MTYSEATEYLFTSLPMFQNIGQGAYKPGLETSLELDRMTGRPTRGYMTIHVAGTNGKGSTAHSLAAVCQAAGYRTGLYTSPHLVDFRERIKVNGEMISEEAVIDFVKRMKSITLKPSFFEMTTAMAFEHFYREKCDIAIIETGLGGRLDSTNIITPSLSIITNIGLDHTALLGDTHEAIAREKAGIIKPGVKVVVGECATESVREVFIEKARSAGSEIIFADKLRLFDRYENCGDHITYRGTDRGDIDCDLTGSCQWLNMRCVLATLRNFPLPLTSEAVRSGLSSVASSTGLMARWMKVCDSPLTVCDTGHNCHAWRHIAPRLATMPGRKHLILGFVSDKTLDELLVMIAAIPDATVYLTQSSVRRALPVESLARQSEAAGITDVIITHSVAEAYKKACGAAAAGDTIFIGGSTFVVADFLNEASR